MMKDKIKIERVELFGDTCKIIYNFERKQFQGVGRVSPTDVSRLLDKLSEHYSTSRTKRGKRIAEISNELSKLVKADCNFYADTYSYIAGGETLLFESDVKTRKMENEY